MNFKFRSGHVFPIDADSDIYTCQTPDKTEDIAGHKAESFSQPPADPAKKRDAEYNDQRFHSPHLPRKEGQGSQAKKQQGTTAGSLVSSCFSYIEYGLWDKLL